MGLNVHPIIIRILAHDITSPSGDQSNAIIVARVNQINCSLHSSIPKIPRGFQVKQLYKNRNNLLKSVPKIRLFRHESVIHQTVSILGLHLVQPNKKLDQMKHKLRKKSIPTLKTNFHLSRKTICFKIRCFISPIPTKSCFCRKTFRDIPIIITHGHMRGSNPNTFF